MQARSVLLLVAALSLLGSRPGLLRNELADVRTSLPRVVLGEAGPEIVDSRLLLRAGVAYELRNDLLVQAGELVIEPGTRIEALPGTGIDVSRVARIVAAGTTTRPIVFTCRPPAAPGCWRGITLNGSATINTGTQDSPVIPDRTSSGNCLQVAGVGQAYGGCEDADSSGVLSNIWILNPGQSNQSGLRLRGVGSTTVLEHIQVQNAGGAAIEVLGGTANMRYVRAITPTGVALQWDQGWRGGLQFGIVQTDLGSSLAIQGSNLADNPDALPRSAPVLRNVTILGPPALDSISGVGAIRLHSGSAATLQSFLLSRRPSVGNWAFDIDGIATWAQFVAGAIRFERSVFLGYATLGEPDDDPIDASLTGLHSPDAEGQALRLTQFANRMIFNFDSLHLFLKEPYGPLPDLRPRPDGPLATAICALPAGSPFFENVSYCGALTTNLTSTLLPWNEPGPPASLPAVPADATFGYLQVRVFAPALGSGLGGVRVHVSGQFGVTDGDGIARLYVRSGTGIYTLSHLPAGCQDPGFTIFNMPASGFINDLVPVQCTAPPAG